MTDKEKLYDKKIAPKVAELAKLCDSHDMSFIGIVEYEPNETGKTFMLDKNSGLAMKMLKLCALTGTNVDNYLFHLKKYCQDNEIDTRQSVVLGWMDRL